MEGVVFTESVNERIFRAFKELNIKQADFAKRIEVSQAFVSKLFKENSDKNPSDRTIKAICRVCKVNEAWLRTGEEPMFALESNMDALLASSDLDDLDKKIITNYLKLSSKQREAFKTFLLKMLE